MMEEVSNFRREIGQKAKEAFETAEQAMDQLQERAYEQFIYVQRRASFLQFDMLDNKEHRLFKRWMSVSFIAVGLYLWFLSTWVNSPTPVFSSPLIASVSYILFIRIGTTYMHRRQPPQRFVFEALFAYNLLQLVLNAWKVYFFLVTVIKLEMTTWGNTLTYAGTPLQELVYIHYLNCFLDLVHTIFLIVLKKYDHLSFLHVYVRLLLLWNWYVVAEFGAYGDSYFGALTQSIAAFVCYSYYVTSLLSFELSYIKNLVTKLQMCEFSVCIFHSFYVIYAQNMHFTFPLLQGVAMVQLLLLYTNFQFNRAAVKPVETLAFSFDSTGWLYLYHFGVGRFVKDHVKDYTQYIYSGSSGGCLVAASLCAGIDIDDLIDFVISCQPICRFNPFRMLPCAEEAIKKYVPDDTHTRISNRLRVLTTKVVAHPPFFMGCVHDEFDDFEDLKTTLRASCHVPFVAGLLPYRTRRGLFYDGLFWSSSLFVPWRNFGSGQFIKVSPFAPAADLFPSVTIPFWWALFPPSKDVCCGIVELGYKDAYNYLKQHPETGLKMVGEMRELKHFKKFEAVARFTWRVSIFSFIAIVGAVVNYLATVGYWSFMTLLWFLLPLVVSIWG